MQRPIGAIVLAAGLGTRMRSAQAKVLHCLGGRPLITYPLAALRSIGVDPIVVVVGYHAEAVQAACAPYNTRFALQQEQKGTGHAVRMAEPVVGDFDGDLLLIYGDLPFLRAETFQNLIAAHQAAHASVSLLTTSVPDPSGFGRVVRDERGRVSHIVEDRDARAAERAIREINVGVYCADAAFLFPALAQLTTSNAQGEYYLTDIIDVARAEGASIADARADESEGAQISSRADLAALEKTLRDSINEKWMAAGVTLEDPATTYIGPDVTIGRDTIVGPNVILRGATRIGQRCRLDGTALLVEATLGDDVHVKFAVVITESELGDAVVVGPFAQLRPRTRLGPRVHIGDFVETKNAVLGAGTKASHHAYLGDVTIGADTNIGAGTITCNYDGFQKHHTTIGSRVQVGSDSQLIAPVTVGDDAFIATGTTVRKDVPPWALAFNEKRQLHRGGWVKAWRARQRTTSAPHAPSAAPRTAVRRKKTAKPARPIRSARTTGADTKKRTVRR